MTMKVENDKGEEIEVYTAEEVQAKTTEAALAKENEYKPKLTAAEQELERVNGILSTRTDEFKQFRKLSDEQVAKLTAAEKTIYENGLLLEEERKKGADRDKASQDSMVTNAIKAKVGSDEKLFTKVKDMYGLIGIQANTQQEVERKVLATLGALGQTEPDLVASISGFSVGSFEPPKPPKEGDKSFADTEQGKKGAAELGIILEAPKK